MALNFPAQRQIYARADRIENERLGEASIFWKLSRSAGRSSCPRGVDGRFDIFDFDSEMADVADVSSPRGGFVSQTPTLESSQFRFGFFGGQTILAPCNDFRCDFLRIHG